jgi:hypothetical protein
MALCPMAVENSPTTTTTTMIITECSMNVHWMFTECSLNVHRMFTECSLNIHWMFTECFLTLYRRAIGWASSCLYFQEHTTRVKALPFLPPKHRHHKCVSIDGGAPFNVTAKAAFGEHPPKGSWMSETNQGNHPNLYHWSYSVLFLLSSLS